MNDWRPTSSIATLKQRAEYIKKIRTFFAVRNVLEVETPLLSDSTIPDPNINSFKTTLFNEPFYLQTSPEFHMKRLLAAGSGCIFQISKAFRVDEISRLHNPEFTMLEWYRLEFSAQMLMKETDEFFQSIFSFHPAIYYSYQEIFQKFLSVDPLEEDVNKLKLVAKKQGIDVHGLTNDKDDWLNLLMSHCIEPQLNKPHQPYFIYHFPITQAALAKQSEKDPRVAERFEVYIHGMEIANGFHELTDATEQRKRFELYLTEREKKKLETLPMPERFLEALNFGLPSCSGIAVGVDRILMIMSDLKNIESVVSFSIRNA